MAMGFIQDELDLKLLVMYIISRAAAPITFLQLYEIALCDAGVDYFSLNQAVQHLVKTGNLHQEGELFSPTEKGRRNSEITDTSLPYSVRTRCDENLVALNDALRREKQIRAEVTPSQDDNGPLMELSALMPTPQAAAAAAARFRREPDVFYHKIITLLCAPEETDPGERK